ncbi:MAG TPA: hypothetical protein VNY31_01315 [Solirubrobacteraceae bacterium]|jgi:choline dehydrogenase-like flavoprotein|nr:hypothetical protein [Solirubrobacteraceae bacterium]
MTSSYDVIVIGSGAGGGTLVHRLAPSGKRVLLRERGDWLQREPQSRLAQDVFVDGRYMSADIWYDEKDKPFQPQVGKSQAPMFHGEKPLETKFAPKWSLEDIARHAVDFWLSIEDLPWPRTASR